MINNVINVSSNAILKIKNFRNIKVNIRSFDFKIYKINI